MPYPLTPAGVPIVNHLQLGQVIRAGSTVAHPSFIDQGLPATATVIEIVDPQHVELNNGLTLPLVELHPIATKERWVEMVGVVVPYLLSDQGKVVSLRYSRQNRERLLLASIQGRYPKVSLLLEKHSKNYPVARLVAQHFLPPPTEARLTQLLHRDQNPLNAHYTNLQWVNKAEIQDAYIDRLLRRRGQDHYRAKLTTEQVSHIRNLARQGKLLTALAQEFGVSLSAISHLVQGRTWRAIPSLSPIALQNAPKQPGHSPQSLSSLPEVAGERRTAAGFPLVDYLSPGQPLRAGATVTHEGFSTHGFSDTVFVVEVMSAAKVKLSNGQNLPLAELQRVETQERWVYIQGNAAHWLLSDQGKVVDVRYNGTARERLLCATLRQGHPNLVLMRGKRAVNTRVADLVAQYFLPPPPTRKLKYALPRDGNPLHIAATNLQWGENPDASLKGTLNHRLLSDEQVAEILTRHQRGQTLKQMAEAFGVSTSTIGRITIAGEPLTKKANAGQVSLPGVCLPSSGR